MKQEVRDISVPVRTHDIFVKVSVWPCNDGAMRAPVPLEANNSTFILRRVTDYDENPAHVFPDCVSSP
jgi:hypothetical protein